MTKFIVFDKTTGQLIRTGAVAEWDVQLQATGPNESVLALADTAAAVDDDKHYVDLTGKRPMVRTFAASRLVAVPKEPSFSKMPSGQRRLPG